MEWGNMVLQITFQGKTEITKFTFEWIFFMKWGNMVFQITFQCKTEITKFTFEWIFLMEWGNLVLQITFQGKAEITKFTFEWLLNFMDILNMIINITWPRMETFFRPWRWYFWRENWYFSWLDGFHKLFNLGNEKSVLVISSAFWVWVISAFWKWVTSACT